MGKEPLQNGCLIVYRAMAPFLRLKTENDRHTICFFLKHLKVRYLPDINLKSNMPSLFHKKFHKMRLALRFVFV